MTREELLLAQKEYLFPAVFHFYAEPLVIARAKNQFVYDDAGNEYLDFFGGIVTISVGHCNPEVNAAVHKQIDTLEHVSTVFATEPQVALAKRIATLTPNQKLTKMFFTNSGTEANELAILAARAATGSTEIVALRHSYHGRSSLGMSLTGQAAWRLGLPQAGVVHAQSPYCYRCPYGEKYPDCGLRCATDVEDVIRTTTSGQIAGFIAEPIQGVGGFITPPLDYFQSVEKIVRNYGGLLILDEVQTAWGRTGSWFAFQQYNVAPDILTGAKGLGNGLPIGLTAATPAVADKLRGVTISTFGGNPVATTAAKAVIDFIDSNNLAANAQNVGSHLRAGLEELKRKHPLIGDVRGMGLLQAVELVEDRASKTPAPAATLRLLEEMRRNRVLAGKGGLYGNVIRISPPLNVSKQDTDEFLARFDASITAIA